jgi:hypothetical protein
MSNRYDAFSGLRNSVLHTASFLRATARRVDGGGLSKEEIIARLEDCSASLCEADREADRKYFTPDPPQSP